MSSLYRLSEIYELQMGKTPSRDNKDYWIDGQYEWISIADISKCDKYISKTKEKITLKAVKDSGIRIIPHNTLIMSFKLSIGKVAITQNDIFSNEAIMAFIDKGVARIIPQYAYYLFSAQKWDKGVNRAVMGTTLNKATLSQYKVNVHSVEEQLTIIEKLDRIVGLIALRSQQLKKIDDLVKSQFIEMFGGYSLRDKRADWVKISAVAEVVGGSTPKTDKCEYWSGSYYWITPAEIASDSYIINNTERKLTKEGVQSCSLKLLPVGTVLLSSRAPIGKVAIAGVEMYCNQGFKNLICSEVLNSVYAYYLLKLNLEYLNSLGRGATFKEISKAIVDNISIPVPPIELQNEFARFVEQTDKSKVLMKCLQILCDFSFKSVLYIRMVEKDRRLCYNISTNIVR